MSVAALLLAAAVLLRGRSPSSRRRLVADVGERWSRPSTRHSRADPFGSTSAFDVLAVCLKTGMPVATAAGATAPTAPPLLRAVLQRAADTLALGADPDTAWSAPHDADEQCQSLMRLARRSAHSGSALGRAVEELAEQSRRYAVHTAAAAAERAGVLIAGPLGLCFLPAFICLGIVPVIAGLAGDVFAGVLS